jgi:HEAT repeat protein
MNRRISQHEKKAFDTIYRDDKNKLLTLFSQKKILHADITLIDSLTSYACIPYLAPLTLCSEYSLRLAAIGKLSLLIESLPDVEWNWLDEALRNRFYNYSSSRLHKWRNLDVHHLGEYYQDDVESNITLKLLACHFNGFIREKALTILSSRSLSGLVPILFIRTNDWVQKIRLIAYTELWGKIDNLSIDELLESIFLIDQLRRRQRVDHEKLLDFIDKKLSSDDAIEKLENLLHSSENGISKISFELCNRLTNDKRKLLHKAIASPNPVVRLRTLKSSSTAFSGMELKLFLEKFTHDDLGSIRKQAIYLLVEHFPKGVKNTLHALLFDTNKGVRESAQFYSQRLCDDIPSDIYKSQLKQGDQKNISSIILGLGESGCKADWFLISPYLNHHRPKIRAAALMSIGRLKLDEHVNVLYDRLLGDMPAERKAARKSLIDMDAVDINKLKDIYFLSDNEMTSKAIRKMIVNYNKWEGLTLILKEINSLKKQADIALLRELNQWLAKKYSNDYCSYPNKTQSVEIIQLATQVTHLVEDRRVKQMLIEKIRFIDLNYKLTLKTGS